MSDTKDNGGFLRKVVRFVSHPTLDWADLGPGASDSQESEDAKSELKASIERRKRNDFVRRREFDMLRKVRREGLSEAVLGAMGQFGLDSEIRTGETVLRSDILGMRAKIDAIEQQMVGESGGLRLRPDTAREVAPPALSSLSQPSAPGLVEPGPSPSRPFPAETLPPSPTTFFPSLPPSLPPETGIRNTGLDEVPLGEVNETVYDSELDEVVMAFANANFSDSEKLLRALVAPEGPRVHDADTWLVLFDLYRATGQQARFESLALDYANRFGKSAPQWFSLPSKAAEIAHKSSASPGDTPPAPLAPNPHGADWICPASLDGEAVEALRAHTENRPAPWLLDWSPLQQLTPEGAAALCALLREWSGRTQETGWLGGGRLQAVLQEATPQGRREVDPSYWLLRLEILRLFNRPDRFDEVAIDYCLTYEMSPPSWEPAQAKVLHYRGDPAQGGQLLTQVGEVTTIFLESQITQVPAMVEVASVDLSGQLVGDISTTLQDLEHRVGDALVLKLGCAGLIRVDFLAAGDLLNWVTARRAEGRTVQFLEAHRLLALFLGAMGITEHAQVQVRKD